MIKTIFSIFLICLFILSASFTSAKDKEFKWLQERRRIADERVLSRNVFGRDNPFAPFFKKVEKSKPAVLPSLHCNGILWSKKSPRAIINDTPVGIGAKIHGMQVVEINKDNVILEFNDKRYVLDAYGLREEQK